MVPSHKTSVDLLGIDSKDQHFIKVVFKLSESRDKQYTIFTPSGDDYEDFLNTDIVFVDKDNQNSVDIWKKMMDRTSDKNSISTVFITKHKSESPQENEIQKPLVALRVLNLLDQFEIPEKVGETPSVVPDTSSPVSSHPEYVNNNVLVIDDSPSVRNHIGNELNKYDCSIDFASNAEEGYWLIQKNIYALVFLDVILPGMNGHELCKDIKTNSMLRDTPIVMLTSKSSPFDRVKGRLSGCNDYLTKPVKAGKLHQIIEKYLLDEKAIAN